MGPGSWLLEPPASFSPASPPHPAPPSTIPTTASNVTDHGPLGPVVTYAIASLMTVAQPHECGAGAGPVVRDSIETARLPRCRTQPPRSQPRCLGSYDSRPREMAKTSHQ